MLPGKKREREKKMGLSLDQARARDADRRSEAREELEKLNRRRAEREVRMTLLRVLWSMVSEDAEFD